MRWPLARRLLALPLTVLVVTVLAFAALSAGGTGDPSLAHLPRFLNTRPDDVRALADAAVDVLARGDDETAQKTLARLGGAALPIVLPRLDGLAPGPRGRVALALAPIALRMELPDDHRDPTLAVASWQHFWADRAREFRPAAIRRAVRRYLSHPSPARLAELRLLDTAAVPDLVTEIARASDTETSLRLLPVAEHALDLPPLADPVARLERLQALWGARGLDFVQLEGAYRPIVAVTETRYGKWARHAVAGDLGRARDGRAVLSLVLASTRTTMLLVVPGALVGAVIAIALSVAVAARRSRGVSLLAGAVALGALCPLAAFSFGGASCVAAFVLAVIAPGLSARLSQTLASPTWVLARATGASELRIALRALRGGALPFALAALGANLPGAFSAAFVAEKIIGLPGLGKVAADAVAARDLTVLMAIAVLASLSAIVALAIADLAQIVGDARVEDAP